MTDSEWRSIHGILMTSEPIEAHGGVRIPSEMLADLAKQIKVQRVLDAAAQSVKFAHNESVTVT